MKAVVSQSPLPQAGGALVLTMIITTIALATLGGVMAWSANSTRNTHRAIQYSRSIAAAEATTEKVIGQMVRDFLQGGDRAINDNLNNYRNTVLRNSDSPYWGQWAFDDGAGHGGLTFVNLSVSNKFMVSGSAYSGLKRFVTIYQVASHARDGGASQDVVAGVMQEVNLERIPIFQYTMYSSGNMEISCGQPFTINGRVHSNKELYVLPDSSLTFQSDVTAVGDILFQRHPLDNTRGAPKGAVVYSYPERKVAHIQPLTLPIGVDNTPEAIREIIQPPPAGELPDSPLGRLRYYNQVDLMITVSGTNVVAQSGLINNFATILQTNDWQKFVTITNTFNDAREGKTVSAIDLDINMLRIWSNTNTTLSKVLPSKEVTSVYVNDLRVLPGSKLGAVRVRNGRALPPKGLTVATSRPLYVWGHYNQTNNTFLNTTNTTTTKPSSLVADAITILSTNWLDANSFNTTAGLDARIGAPTTVNAALLTGAVETTSGKYSGGMENFPRFLEKWGSGNPLTYAGSMIKMFPSRYATNAWGTGSVYDPPKRVWTYDLNFDDGNKLPPLTPSFVRVARGQWYALAPNKNSK